MFCRGAVARARSTHVFAHSRTLSSRASAVLNALDIPAAQEIPGVYDGAWSGTGEVLESVCPTTGEVLARVQGVCASDERVRGVLICKIVGVASGATDRDR
jgi:aldehyde dehydrogenase family 7 member A1